MKFAIVGVGQTFNFETKQMEDMLQVQAPDGSILSVPTTNEAAQALVKLAMNGHGDERYMTETKAFTPETEIFRQQTALASQGELAGRVEERFTPPEGAEDFPDGADIFGGEPIGMGEGPIDGRDLAPPPVNVVEEQVQQQIFKKTQQAAKAPNKLGLRRNPADRSGVPSYGIARVDEMGNPVLPAAPDNTIEDEEDPGEQV
jgi:hypothetical protein